MDLNKNYYDILGINKDANDKEIKKAYYKLSFVHHPDKGGDPIIFNEITEAYNVLCEQRDKYDQRSRWGNNYDELNELLNINDDIHKTWDDDKYNVWKNKNKNNIVINVPEDFDGKLEFNRYVCCKACGGSGTDTKSKIVIKDEEGNIKSFEGEDGCDFCEGTGKGWDHRPCKFCGGVGKVGASPCKKCNGDRKILGKQKISNVKWEAGKRAIKIISMGNYISKDKYGDLWLVKPKENKIQNSIN